MWILNSWTISFQNCEIFFVAATSQQNSFQNSTATALHTTSSYIEWIDSNDRRRTSDTIAPTCRSRQRPSAHSGHTNARSTPLRDVSSFRYVLHATLRGLLHYTAFSLWSRDSHSRRARLVHWFSPGGQVLYKNTWTSTASPFFRSVDNSSFISMRGEKARRSTTRPLSAPIL
jgi:hypothetical protein